MFIFSIWLLGNFSEGMKSGGCFGGVVVRGEERTECGKDSIFFRQGGPYRVHTICSFLVPSRS